MKSKNIPADIRAKSVEEAQNEIKQIIKNLENNETNLRESTDKYNRMMHLNYHIQDEFRKKLKEIQNNKNSSNKD
jgi:exonuclease VII small subunit|tara:strand:+ start:237 stop:461 length:225 start_codon:yes stop_codon:yes gene_type:complete